MDLTVIVSGGSDLVLQLSLQLGATVADLQTLIASRTGLQPGQQQLLFNGQPLQPRHAELRQLGVGTGDLLELEMAGGGGGGGHGGQPEAMKTLADGSAANPAAFQVRACPLRLRCVGREGALCGSVAQAWPGSDRTLAPATRPFCAALR